MIKIKAFSLIEALVAVTIAGIVTVGVFSYFSDSIRGVAHSEKTMNALSQLQEISRKVRQQIYHMNLNHAGVGIDLCKGPQFKSVELSESVPDRIYPIRLIEVRGKEGLLEVDPSIVNYSKDYNDGKLIAVERRQLDRFFQGKNFPSQVIPYENALVVRPKEKNQQKITDYYLFTQGRKIIWRHHEDPANYLEVINVDEAGEEEILEEFGKAEKNVVNFSLNPVNEIVYYKPNPKGNMRTLRFLRFYVQVHLSIRTEKSDRGPSGGTFSNSFIVTSLFLNANRFGRGKF